ncbi:MAG: hypothetical protein IPN60_10090 [Saprospiraceae bacterium]|nr:hypothetical protein [Candidatus Opimibacter skivensis]
MKITNTGSEILRNFSPQMEHTSMGEKIWITILLLTLGVAGYAFICRLPMVTVSPACGTMWYGASLLSTLCSSSD